MLAKEKMKKGFAGYEGACVCRNPSLSDFYCFLSVWWHLVLPECLWDSWLLFWSFMHIHLLQDNRSYNIFQLHLRRNALQSQETPDRPLSLLDSKNHLCLCYGHPWSHWQCVRCSPFPKIFGVLLSYPLFSFIMQALLVIVQSFWAPVCMTLALNFNSEVT